jgi:predicted aldo/keto reductase-like oxidoreductase
MHPFLETSAFNRAVPVPLPAIAAPVCRLGLATRGDGDLALADVQHALDAGINFLNWCGTPDALSQTIAELGRRRSEVLICTQFEARTATEAAAELESQLRELRCGWIDILTLYYVEEAAEWEQIAGPGGSLEFCRQAQRDGKVRQLGITSHQRPLAAQIAASGLIDLLMIRYNAAHRGAERDIFPVTDAHQMPVIVYTCLRWGALLRSTRDDPSGFVAPRAPAWYRFALQSPSVAIALAAPGTRVELDETLEVLRADGPLDPAEYEVLAAHGQRVRANGGGFP